MLTNDNKEDEDKEDDDIKDDDIEDDDKDDNDVRQLITKQRRRMKGSYVNSSCVGFKEQI